MMYDIAAIQWMYGAQETNEGNTVYGSNDPDSVIQFDPATSQWQYGIVVE